MKEGKNVATRIVYPKPASLNNFSLDLVKPLDITGVKIYKFKAEIGKIIKTKERKT